MRYSNGLNSHESAKSCPVYRLNRTVLSLMRPETGLLDVTTFQYSLHNFSEMLYYTKTIATHRSRDSALCTHVSQ